MESKKFSIVIPVYNGAKHMEQTLQSALNQDYENYEVIVVDDASTDGSREIINKFHDPKLKKVFHEKNLGAETARDTGINISSGDFVALLDQDDLFHPKKLQIHAEYFNEHPEIGSTYNNRFDLDYDDETIRNIWRPPLNLALNDIVLGFPVAPSEMVFRGEWIKRLDLKNIPYHGGEYLILAKLFFDGCRFGNVDKALNYRRYHAGRIIRDLSGSCLSEKNAQKLVFDDPHCPEEILKLKGEAFQNTYMIFSYFALIQSDFILFREFLSEAMRLRPEIMAGTPNNLLNFFVENCTNDRTVDFAILINNFFENIPPLLKLVESDNDWALGRGYLIKGCKAIIWDEPENAKNFFNKAIDLHAMIDETFLRKLTSDLLNYENEFGLEMTDRIIENLIPHISRVDGKSKADWLLGRLYFNRGVNNYHSGRDQKAYLHLLKAFQKDPTFIFNRGFWSIIFKSLLSEKVV